MSFPSKHIDFAFTFSNPIKKKKSQQQYLVRQLVAAFFLLETMKSSLWVTLALWCQHF